MEFGDWGSDFGSYDYGGDWGGGGDYGWGGGSDYGYSGWDSGSYDWGGGDWGSSSYDWSSSSYDSWGGGDWGSSSYDWSSSSYDSWGGGDWGSSSYDWSSSSYDSWGGGDWGSSNYDWSGSGYDNNYDWSGSDWGGYSDYNAQYAGMSTDESRVWMDGKPLDGGQPTWPGAGNERFINDPLNMDMNDRYMLEYLRDNPEMISPDNPQYRDYYRNQIDQFLQDNQNGTDRLFPSPESPALPPRPTDALPTGIG